MGSLKSVCVPFFKSNFSLNLSDHKHGKLGQDSEEKVMAALEGERSDVSFLGIAPMCYISQLSTKYCARMACHNCLGPPHPTFPTCVTTTSLNGIQDQIVQTVECRIFGGADLPNSPQPKIEK